MVEYMRDLKIHPAADVFPMLSDEELRVLADDIAKNGLQHPVMTWNDVIVDGRNRWMAAKKYGCPIRTEDIEFESEEKCIRYIISTNIHRRHLTESQRADISAALANLEHGDNQHRTGKSAAPITQAQAAKMMGVSERLVRDAKMVQEQAPDLAAKVKAGELKVSRAAAMARERTKPVEPPTDPDQAADSVIDASEGLHAEGWTPRARNLLAAAAKLDDTEKTAIRDDMAKILGLRCT